jgi:hypothetical protein
MDDQATWRDALPDTLKAVPSLQKFDSIEGLANSFIQLEQYQGNSVRIPGPDATADDQLKAYSKVMERMPGLVRKPVEDDAESMSQFWSSLGKPEKADDYAAIDGLSPEQTEFMRNTAFESNMTGTQFRQFAEKFAGQVTMTNEESAFAAKSEYQELEQEWGMAKDTKMQAIRMMAAQLQMDESLMDSITSDVPNVKVLRLMDTIVRKIGSEGSALQTQIGENGTSVMSPQEAEAQIAEIMGRPEYRDTSSPMQAGLVRKVVELGRFADPNASTSMASNRSGFGTIKATDTMFQ